MADKLPEDVQTGQFTPLNEMELIDGRYMLMIELKAQSDKEANQPIWDMFIMFDKPLTQDKARDVILNTSIKNWVLNILNSMAWVKWFHAYSDYLVLLGLVDWQEKVKEQLTNTFDYSLKQITEEEYEEVLKQREEAKKKQIEEQAPVDLPQQEESK